MEFYKFTEDKNSLLRETILGKNVREEVCAYLEDRMYVFLMKKRKNKQKNSKTWIDLDI